MSPPDETSLNDLEQIAALVRDGDQRIAGEILAMRTRLIEFGDALTEIREKIGMPGSVRASRIPPPSQTEPPPPAEPVRAEPSPDVSPADTKQIESLRIPLVDLTRRLEQAMDSVRDVEAFRVELSKEGEAIGERVGARAERSFRRLEEAFAAMRMQLDSVANQVRARPEAEFAASIRAQMQQAATELQHDVVTLGEDMRAQVTQLAQDLRREVAVEVTKELEELREPVRALREHAAALRQISGLDELAADLASVSRHLETIDARIGSLGAHAGGQADPADRIAAMLGGIEARLVAAMDARIGSLGAIPDPGFLGSFGTGEIEEEETGIRRFFGRRRVRDDEGRAPAEAPSAPPEAPETAPRENFFSGPETAFESEIAPEINDASQASDTHRDAHDVEDERPPKTRRALPGKTGRAKAAPAKRAPRATNEK